LNGIQEIVGSIHLSSTNYSKGLEGFPSKPFFVEYTKEYTNDTRGWGSCNDWTRLGAARSL